MPEISSLVYLGLLILELWLKLCEAVLKSMFTQILSTSKPGTLELLKAIMVLVGTGTTLVPCEAKP